MRQRPTKQRKPKATGTTKGAAQVQPAPALKKWQLEMSALGDRITKSLQRVQRRFDQVDEDPELAARAILRECQAWRLIDGDARRMRAPFAATAVQGAVLKWTGALADAGEPV